MGRIFAGMVRGGSWDETVGSVEIKIKKNFLGWVYFVSPCSVTVLLHRVVTDAGKDIRNKIFPILQKSHFHVPMPKVSNRGV